MTENKQADNHQDARGGKNTEQDARADGQYEPGLIKPFKVAGKINKEINN